MARRFSKPAPRHEALDRLPDRILLDIGLNADSLRRRGRTEFLEELVRHIGPTRS